VSQLPANVAVYVGGEVVLGVQAAVGDGGTLTFQWYMADGASGGAFRPVAGAVGRDFVPDTSTVGINRYRVVITNTNNAGRIDGERVSRTTSRVVTVTVNAPPAIITVTEADLSANLSAGLSADLPFATQIYLADFALDFDLNEVNTHRIVAVDEHGKVAGGTFDTQTGIFTLETETAGIFTITYVETLIRLTLNLSSNIIYDLAGNVNAVVMDVLPMVTEGRTLLPLRFTAYALGASIDWTPSTDTTPLTVFITLNGETLAIPIGILTPELVALGMDTPATLANGRTMIPLRFVGEFFGAIVKWDEEAQTITVVMG